MEDTAFLLCFFTEEKANQVLIFFSNIVHHIIKRNWLHPTVKGKLDSATNAQNTHQQYNPAFHLYVYKKNKTNENKTLLTNISWLLFL